MQKNEIIIEQFIKTINETPLNVTGDPVLLDKIFDGLAKRKRRRKIFSIFLFSGLILIVSSIVIWGPGQSKKEYGNFKALIGISKHPIPMKNNKVVASKDLNEKIVITPAKKVKTRNDRKPDPDFSKSVTYKFNNHQVDVFKNGDEEFLQINVFGADGVEQDVFQIMEDLKKSYKSNEVYVDSVKHK